jgi:hypothetical protein
MAAYSKKNNCVSQVPLATAISLAGHRSGYIGDIIFLILEGSEY